MIEDGPKIIILNKRYALDQKVTEHEADGENKKIFFHRGNVFITFQGIRQ